MKWAVGITTAPRANSTIDITIAGLRKNGWDDINVFAEEGCEVSATVCTYYNSPALGVWSNWYHTLEQLYVYYKADSYMICQDDGVYCNGLKTYLERTLWRDDLVAIYSPYCPNHYRATNNGWNGIRKGAGLHGAVCWIIKQKHVNTILRELEPTYQVNRAIDSKIGAWLERSGLEIYYHTPSLVQHIGEGNSTIKHKHSNPNNKTRVASDFVGEDINYG